MQQKTLDLIGRKAPRPQSLVIPVAVAEAIGGWHEGLESVEIGEDVAFFSISPI